MQRFDRLLVLVALLIAVYMLVPFTSPVISADMSVFGGGPEPTPAPKVVRAILPFEEVSASSRELPPPTEARGLVMTGYTAGSKRFGTLLDLVERTELNAVVLDIKDESGEVSWVTTTPGASIAGAGIPKMRDPKARIAELKEAGVYVIGRIVTFQDPVLSAVRPDLAIRRPDGSRWTTEKGLGWLDPYAPQSQRYALDLATEAASLGFDEIQFDYVRFPTDGDIEKIWYPHRDERPKQQVIQEFLRSAREHLHRLGVYVSADLFGLVTLAEDDMGIGQRLPLIAREVDYISLMLYPSHYSLGNYGIKDPEANPYETIRRSIVDAKKKIAGSGAKLRPWIQDFSLRVRYGPAEVRAQIKALEDEGVNEWLLWNAANRYTDGALRSE